MKTFTVKLTEQDLAALSSALIEAPYKLVASVIASINEQIQAENSAPKED